MMNWIRHFIKGMISVPKEDLTVEISKDVTFGMHLSRHSRDKTEVVFVNKETGRRKTIIDAGGTIVDFPGILKEGKWIHYLESERYLEPDLRFTASFERWDEDKYIMMWMIQPDGRYWEDEDGFGGTSDSEIQLYTFLDENGDFTGPFQVYNVGRTHYLPENT